MSGADLVQIKYHDMEIMDMLDSSTPIYWTAWTSYHHIYDIEHLCYDCGSGGCGFDPRRPPLDMGIKRASQLERLFFTATHKSQSAKITLLNRKFEKFL